MAQTFTSVGVYENSVAAHAARAALEVAGIASFTDGEESVTALSHVGSALGGIKVCVAQEDAEAARRILASQAGEEKLQQDAAWNCPDCGETVVAGFDVCWSCGTSRDGSPDPAFYRDQAGVLNPSQGTASRAPSQEWVSDEDEPEADEESSLLPVDYSGDDRRTLTLRAWRAAVIGLGVCPGVLHAYSAWLLLLASTLPEEPDSGTRLRAWGAATIDIVVFSAIATLAILSVW